MLTGIMIVIFGLMIFGFFAAIYSVISKLTKKGRQRRGPHRKPEQENLYGRQGESDYLNVAHSERIRA